MAARDYELSPVTDRMDLDKVINGLCADLEQLRAGKIGVNDAIARSLLAKQIFNGVRIYLTATKLLVAAKADALGQSASQAERSEGGSPESPTP